MESIFQTFELKVISTDFFHRNKLQFQPNKVKS